MTLFNLGPKNASPRGLADAPYNCIAGLKAACAAAACSES